MLYFAQRRRFRTSALFSLHFRLSSTHRFRLGRSFPSCSPQTIPLLRSYCIFVHFPQTLHCVPPALFVRSAAVRNYSCTPDPLPPFLKYPTSRRMRAVSVHLIAQPARHARRTTWLYGPAAMTAATALKPGVLFIPRVSLAMQLSVDVFVRRAFLSGRKKKRKRAIPSLCFRSFVAFAALCYRVTSLADLETVDLVCGVRAGVALPQEREMSLLFSALCCRHFPLLAALDFPELDGTVRPFLLQLLCFCKAMLLRAAVAAAGRKSLTVPGARDVGCLAICW